MKIRHLSLSLVLNVCSVLIASGIADAKDLFPDKVLEAAVRTQVFEKRNNDEPLTEKDVENVAVIKFKGHTYTLDGKKVQREQKIKDLTGLEKCRSLAELDLEDHEITDVSPLKDLKNIQSLTLAKNKIKDISPLAGLVKLQYLQLEDNQVSDISAVAKMDNMRSLYLSNNNIKNIKPVSKLSKMWSLYLGGNHVKDITPITGLRFLDTIDLSDNGLTDISPLGSLTPSNFLFLKNNKIEDIGVLVEMAKKDRKGEQRFAPFWNVYLNGNPLEGGAKSKQLAELRKQSLASRIHFEK